MNRPGWRIQTAPEAVFFIVGSPGALWRGQRGWARARRPGPSPLTPRGRYVHDLGTGAEILSDRQKGR